MTEQFDLAYRLPPSPYNTLGPRDVVPCLLPLKPPPKPVSNSPWYLERAHAIRKRESGSPVTSILVIHLRVSVRVPQEEVDVRVYRPLSLSLPLFPFAFPLDLRDEVR